jgi:arylsulfatase A
MKNLNRRVFLRSAGAAALGLVGCTGLRPPIAGRKRPPNIVFILIDDMGWTDLGCYGSTFYETPNIDKLARQGMRFTDAYAACTVCSPTRASILTGKYPARLHLTDWIAGYNNKDKKLRSPDWKKYMGLEEVTIAEALRDAGYATAHIGKWHLGNEPYYPRQQGFDVNIGGGRAGQPGSYFYPYKSKSNRKSWQDVPGMDGGKKGEYLTDRLTDEALTYINENNDRPFFMYLAHFAVHTPIQAKKEITDKYKSKPASATHKNAKYAAMIESTDEGVGRIMQCLDENGLSGNTIVVFFSDNGGLVLWDITNNTPLREGKGSAYEGGVREPLIVRWPGVVKPGSVCNTPVISVDLYPTLLQAAGAKGDKTHNRNVDGESIMPLLRSRGELKRDAIYWHYPHYHLGGATPYSAVREGDWKLIEFYEDGKLELYNLKEDIGEQNNQAKEMPRQTDRMKNKLDTWRKKVNAQPPITNKM